MWPSNADEPNLPFPVHAEQKQQNQQQQPQQNQQNQQKNTNEKTNYAAKNTKSDLFYLITLATLMIPMMF